MLYAQPASPPAGAAIPVVTGSAIRGFLKTRGSPAPGTHAEDDARDDAQKPTEHGAREDDPDERGVAAAGYPAQLHLTRVRDHECDQDNDERHQTERQAVEPGAVAVSAEPFPARLDTFGVRQDLLRMRFDLHRSSLS